MICKGPVVLRRVAFCPPALPGWWPGGRRPPDACSASLRIAVAPPSGRRCNEARDCASLSTRRRFNGLVLLW
eukprot:6607879-Alexandrium_andersonii.AAC.1